MNDIHGKEYKLDHYRRPYIHTKITSWSSDNWNPSGVELTLTKEGIAVAGWYDSMVGIQGFKLSWEQFEEIKQLAFQKKSP